MTTASSTARRATRSRRRPGGDLSTPYPGGESWQQAVDRVGRLLGDLLPRWDGARVLVVGQRRSLASVSTTSCWGSRSPRHSPQSSCGSRGGSIRGRGPSGRARQHGRGRDRGRNLRRRHGLRRAQRPQLPQLRAAARRARGGDAAGRHELSVSGRRRPLRVGEPAARHLRVPRPCRRPALSPHALRPRALQPRGPRPDRAQRRRALVARLPGRRWLLASTSSSA